MTAIPPPRLSPWPNDWLSQGPTDCDRDFLVLWLLLPPPSQKTRLSSQVASPQLLARFWPVSGLCLVVEDRALNHCAPHFTEARPLTTSVHLSEDPELYTFIDPRLRFYAVAAQHALRELAAGHSRLSSTRQPWRSSLTTCTSQQFPAHLHSPIRT